MESSNVFLVIQDENSMRVNGIWGSKCRIFDETSVEYPTVVIASSMLLSLTFCKTKANLVGTSLVNNHKHDINNANFH